MSEGPGGGEHEPAEPHAPGHHGEGARGPAFATAREDAVEGAAEREVHREAPVHVVEGDEEGQGGPPRRERAAVGLGHALPRGVQPCEREGRLGETEPARGPPRGPEHRRRAQGRERARQPAADDRCAEDDGDDLAGRVRRGHRALRVQVRRGVRIGRRAGVGIGHGEERVQADVARPVNAWRRAGGVTSEAARRWMDWRTVQ